MRFIAISFTLKGQDFKDIKKVLVQLSEVLEAKSGNVILVHGFMPRAEVIAKGYDVDVVDTLNELFPYQLPCYHNGAPNRPKMAAILGQFGGRAFTIGEIKDGVVDEVALYKSTDYYDGGGKVRVDSLPIGWAVDKLLPIMQLLDNLMAVVSELDETGDASLKHYKSEALGMLDNAADCIRRTITYPYN